MSQEKVDRYKKEKANREKIMRRERWITRLEVTAFVVVLATLIGWFSVAVYQNSVAEKKANRTTETTTMNVTDIQNYLSETNTSSDSSADDTSHSKGCIIQAQKPHIRHFYSTDMGLALILYLSPAGSGRRSSGGHRQRG